MILKKLQQSIKIGKIKPKEDPIDVREYLFSKMKDEVLMWLDGKIEEIKDVVKKTTIDEIISLQKEANKVVKKEIDKVRENELHNIKKGDPGKDSTLPGPKGAKGDSIIGPKGEKGDSIIGPKGDIGSQGIEGKAGKDGSPDKPQEIATKLNTLTEAVEMSVIKGLQEMFAGMQRAFNRREKGGGSGGGGGMGNVTPQSTAISSATTTITLSYNVASNGRAIWLNYQGQQQAYGTHFTVSGKTITLLFTPMDDTFADIIYIRT